MRLTSRSIAAALGFALLAATLALPSHAETKTPPAFLLRTRATRAGDVVHRLDLRTSELPRRHGMDPVALERLMRRDRDLWLDEHQHLFYACEGMELPFSAAGLVAEAGPVSSSSIPNSADAFKLHSLPGALRTLYLDFNGHVTRGTQWNSTKAGGADIVSAPFDFDGNPTAFSASELDRIKRIWQRVAEDFVPFAINVTTEEPSVEALRRTSITDLQYGVRVVISPSSSWYGNAGGVAYLGSFQWNSDTPAFVFCDKLGPNNEKYTAEAISHETGHTFGLSHDGKSDGTVYYGGQGSWAPIMGVSYYKPVTQWSRGEYANASNREDDLAKIQTYGAPVLVDDCGNDLVTATLLTGPSVLTIGVIETRTDVDVYQFTTGAGAIQLSVSGVSIESNCDVKAELLNAAGAVLASSDPTGLSASVSSTVAAGTYFLRIQGVGMGDPVTTGYSDYGSLGEYKVAGTLLAMTSPVAPIAVAKASTLSGVAPLAVTFSSSGSADSDGIITSQAWTFGDGYSSTQANPSHTYTAEGTYIAQLTVIDNAGRSGIATLSIQVTPPPNLAPVAKASASALTSAVGSSIVFFSNGSSDPDGSVTGYHWNFGDGTTSTTAHPTKAYGASGTYAVLLTVTDDRGGKASSGLTVTINPGVSMPGTLDGYERSFESVKLGLAAYSAYLYRPVMANFSFIGNAGIAANGSGFTQGNGPAPDGTQVAFVQKNGSVSLKVLYPAGTYTVRAMIANRANHGGAQTVVVTIDGQLVGTWKAGSTYVSATSTPFTVTGGTHTLTFLGQQSEDCTLLMDKLTIQRAD